MTYFKNLISLSMFFIVLLGGCGKKEDTRKVVSVLLPGSTGYFVATKAGMEKAAEEFNLKLVYSDAQWDPSKQLTQVEDAIIRGVDFIAVAAADSF